MILFKILNQLYNDFSSIHQESKNFSSNYFANFLKITIDKIIKTIGYTSYFFFRNKKYDGKLVNVGNYKILSDNISQSSIIYSCGIAENISFDEAISQKYGCDVFMFDPTERSNKYMNSIDNPKLKFFNIGIWKIDGNIKFYMPKNSGGINFSATNLFKTKMHIYLPCKTIKSLMYELNQTKIDILKMDIEGAAFEILEDILDNNIYPHQIIAEIERPFFIFDANFLELYAYFKRRRKLRSRLKKLGYEVVDLKANEFLAVKLN